MNTDDDLTADEAERITIAAATGRPMTAGPAAGPLTTTVGPKTVPPSA